MPVRQPLPLWIVVGVFALSIAVVPPIGQLLRPPVSLPRSLAESVELLSQCEPPFHAVRANDRCAEAGVYFCERPQSLAQLQLLLRAPEYAYRWRGVVFCERADGFGQIPPEHLESWGEHGRTIGPFVFFGDAEMLRRIESGLLRRGPS